MPLSSGTRIGPYEIVGAIGSGGMGDVYRARDARLGRDVAVKALPPGATEDPERVARFKREAQILAALNHPHIAAIYGLEEGPSTGTDSVSQFLILELAEGGTLADRLGAHATSSRAGDSAFSIDDVLRIGRQIADALEAAHEKSVIHRDLKPGNVALTTSGQVKVLDFGIAKAFADDANAATELRATEPGAVLGTAAYMSPEQTRGLPVDKRTDIWAFGCLLFEMLSGRHAFPGDTRSDVVAAILGREPDWTHLPLATPMRVRWLMRRCLEKDPRNRLHDIADARIELEAAVNRSSDTDLQTALPRAAGGLAADGRRTRERIAWTVAGLALLALLGVYVFGRSAPEGEPAGAVRTYHAGIMLPETLRVSTDSPPGRFALSPDGRHLAVVASEAKDGPTRLWIRPLDSSAALPLPGTEGASFPFWSPDSRSVAFLAQNKLRRIEIASATVLTVCDARFRATGSWNRDGVILFTPRGDAPLHRVSASGGTPVPVTTLDATRGDVQHSFPFFLPDGQHFLYLTVGTKAGGMIGTGGIYVGSLDGKAPGTRLLEESSNAKYANGRLIFMREGTLVSQPFDPATLKVSGEPQPIVEQVQVAGSASTGMSGSYSVSETGVLAFQTGVLLRSQLAWFNRAGMRGANLGAEADHADVVLSPDQSRVATSILDPSFNARDIWVYDAARGLRTRFTTGPDDDFAPVWSSDGTELVFSSRRKGGRIDMYRRSADGSGKEEVLAADELGLGKFATDWSPDRQFLLYIGGGGVIGRSDLWVAALSGDRKAFPFVETAAVESQGRFSPDGQWIAYMSRELGQSEVFVRRFRSAAAPKQVSVGGGGWPRWRRDGKEIVYLGLDDKLMSVPITLDNTHVSAGAPRLLFPVRLRPITRLDAYPYDMSSDAQRFLINTFVEAAPSAAITLIVNWIKDR